MDDYEYELLDMSQEEMERIANGDDPEDIDLWPGAHSNARVDIWTL